MPKPTAWLVGMVVVAALYATGTFLFQRTVYKPALNTNVSTEHELITVFAPRAGDVVESPLTVVGEARGQWFFEATFSIVVVDWDGRIIGEGYATAKDNWMTEDFVPFEATLTFETPNLYNRGAIILQKSNPSGLPEYDDALEIPVIFK